MSDLSLKPLPWPTTDSVRGASGCMRDTEACGQRRPSPQPSPKGRGGTRGTSPYFLTRGDGLFFVLCARKQLARSCVSTSATPHSRGEGARRLPRPWGEGGGEGRTFSNTTTRQRPRDMAAGRSGMRVSSPRESWVRRLPRSQETKCACSLACRK